MYNRSGDTRYTLQNKKHKKEQQLREYLKVKGCQIHCSIVYGYCEQELVQHIIIIKEVHTFCLWAMVGPSEDRFGLLDAASV